LFLTPPPPQPASALDSATALSSSAPSSLVDLLTAYFSSDARPSGDVRRAGPKDSSVSDGSSSYQVVAVPLSWAQVSSYAATAARLSAAIASTREAIARSSDALFSSSSSSSSEEPEWHRRHHHGPHSHHGEAAVSTESNQTVNDQEEPPCVGGALFGFFLIGASAYVAVRAVRTMARRSRERAALRNDSFFAVEGSEPMLVLRTAPAYSKA